MAGIIELLATGILENNGQILASGSDSLGQRGGGGSAGAVYIECESMTGSGKLLDNLQVNNRHKRLNNLLLHK